MIAVLVLALVGCQTDCADGFDRGDDGNCHLRRVADDTPPAFTTTSGGEFTPITRLDDIALPGCDASGKWTYAVTTTGWTNGQNRVNAWEAGGRNEEHPLPSVDFGPGVTWDELLMMLRPTDQPEDYAPGLTTLYTCGVQDVDPVMTYAIRVYDLDGNYADCATLATDPAGIDAVFDGTAPTPNPVTDPEQINRDDCWVWAL